MAFWSRLCYKCKHSFFLSLLPSQREANCFAPSCTFIFVHCLSLSSRPRSQVTVDWNHESNSILPPSMLFISGMFVSVTENLNRSYYFKLAAKISLLSVYQLMADLISKEDRRKGFSLLIKRLAFNYHDELLKVHIHWWKEKIQLMWMGLYSHTWTRTD